MLDVITVFVGEVKLFFNGEDDTFESGEDEMYEDDDVGEDINGIEDAEICKELEFGFLVVLSK